jgi:hypothetical protein
MVQPWMKVPALLLGLAAAMPGVAQAQLPVAAPAEPTRPAPTSATEKPADSPAPGDQYFLDSAPPPASAPPPEPPVSDEPAPFEPPLPVSIAFEPPPPPEPRQHRAPSNSLWLGARLGWFVPFGNAWSRAKPLGTSSSSYTLEGVPWRDYVASGPMFEVDAGLRLGRAYTLFALWERAELGAGDATSDGMPDRAESDFWAAGLRVSSDPDRLAFVTEVAVGYRRARTFYTNGTEVQFTDAPFEARLGLGAELRLSRLTSVSSLVTIGVGGFGTVEKVTPDGNAVPKLLPSDQGDGHGWVTLSVGASFDLLPSRN